VLGRRRRSYLWPQPQSLAFLSGARRCCRTTRTRKEENRGPLLFCMSGRPRCWTRPTVAHPLRQTGFDDLDLGQFRVGVSELVVRAPSGGDQFCRPACPRIERSGCVCSSAPPGSSGLTAFGYKQHRAFPAKAPRPGGWFFGLPPGAAQRRWFTRQPRVRLVGRIRSGSSMQGGFPHRRSPNFDRSEPDYPVENADRFRIGFGRRA
jgi:hypothetical protein